MHERRPKNCNYRRKTVCSLLIIPQRSERRKIRHCMQCRNYNNTYINTVVRGRQQYRLRLPVLAITLFQISLPFSPFSFIYSFSALF